MFKTVIVLVVLVAALAAEARCAACSKCNRQPPSVGRPYVDKTAFVDPVYGDDNAGRVEVFTLPFKTIGAAMTAVVARTPSSTAVWQIQLRPGTYTENVVLHSCVNLLGVSTIGGVENAGPEVIVRGELTDASVSSSSGCTPSVTAVAFYSTTTPALSLTSGAGANIIASVFETTCTSSGCINTVLGGSPASFSLDHTTFDVTGFGALIVIQLTSASAFLELTAGEVAATPTGNYTLTLVDIVGTTPITSLATYRRLLSHDMFYQVTLTAHHYGPVNVFAADNANVISLSDTVQFYLAGGITKLTLANLGGGAGVYQQANIEAMVVDFLPRASPQTVTLFYTVNNNNHLNSTAFVQNLRTRGWSGSTPTQTTANLGNTFREVAVLTDLEQGGQSLVQTRIVAVNGTVNDIDAVLIWTGASAGQLLLPLAAQFKGRVLTFKDASNTAVHELVVRPTGTDKIDGSNALTLLTKWSSARIVSDGLAHWYTI